MPALLNQGKTKLRDALRGVANSFIAGVALATDQTAFNATQTEVDPANAGAANLLIKGATFTVVDANTIDVTIDVDGTTELTGKNIYTIALTWALTRVSAITRYVRSNSIGVQSGDAFTIGARYAVEDNTP